MSADTCCYCGTGGNLVWVLHPADDRTRVQIHRDCKQGLVVAHQMALRGTVRLALSSCNACDAITDLHPTTGRCADCEAMVSA